MHVRIMSAYCVDVLIDWLTNSFSGFFDQKRVYLYMTIKLVLTGPDEF